MSVRTNRRSFLKAGAAAAAVVSFPAASWARVAGANSRVRIASIGCGGKGWSDLEATAASPHADVIALCDIDESANFLGRAATKYSKAKTYTDWRKLLEAEKDLDGVIVSTPDHMHAPPSLAAMALGKAVQCQKPLTHTVFESRQMTLAARKAKVVTQMGNQIQSHSAYRTAVAGVHAGVIGKVKYVHSWQAGNPSWRKTTDRPEGSDPVPAGVHWDEWLGVAPVRPFKKDIYHSFNWRNFQDFANGNLGDFGCHILDPVFMALKLTAPTKLRAIAPPMNSECWPVTGTVFYEFPETELTAGSAKVIWHDGVGVFPSREGLGLPESYKLPGAGSVLVGEKGTMVIPHVAMPKVFKDGAEVENAMPVVESRDHYTSWIDAIRGEDKTTSHFDYSGPLTETVLLGTIGFRRPEADLVWDSANLKLTGAEGVQDMLTKKYRKGWEPAWV